MSEVRLHATPRWPDVVTEQVWFVGLSLRREALVAAMVLGFGTLLIVSELLSGGPGFDSREMLPTALLSFFLPFAVWRGEKRFSPAFLWTLPVDRRRLALARVFAGGVWLMAALAVLGAWLFALAMIADVGAAHQVLRIPFIETMAMYLFGSAVVLGLRHPARWLLGVAGVVLLLGALTKVRPPNDSEWPYLPGGGPVFSFIGRVLGASPLPDLTQWAVSNSLLIAAALLALWLAASRHRERRHQ